MRQNHSTDIKPLLGLPADYFISPKIYRRVKENIYFNTWQLACHAGQVQKPGDYYEFSVFDQDIFIVRGKDKKLRAFIMSANIAATACWRAPAINASSFALITLGLMI